MDLELDATQFRLTEEHLKLLRRFSVGWQQCEFGAPEIDPKRPYGNSFVVGDIVEILDWKPPMIPDPEWKVLEDQAKQVHRETAIALQIVVLNAGEAVEPGLYVKRNQYDHRSWERVSD